MANDKLVLEPEKRLGRYELKARLALGGMAEVWLAEATGISGFHKTVVLKTILPQFADDPNFARMLTNEALLAAVLNHHNIVQIFDLGEIEGTYFIAMEFISGRTLRQIQRTLAKSGQIAPPWLTLHVLMAVCDALEYAHNMCGESGQPLHIVHRDVTPENIMVSFAGVTKVLDFGIAKARSAASHTQAGTLKGKFAYMAPERIQVAQDGGAADRRSDIYSIGVILYEMLTGTLPFKDSNELMLLRKILEEPPPPPRKPAPWIPERLEAIVLKAMAKDPTKRHQTAAELREDVSEFLVKRRAVTTTERHVAKFMSTTFEVGKLGVGQEIGAAGSLPPSKSRFGKTPIERHGFDPVKPLSPADKPTSSGATSPSPTPPAGFPAVSPPQTAGTAPGQPPPGAGGPLPTVERGKAVGKGAEPSSAPRPVSSPGAGSAPKSATPAGAPAGEFEFEETDAAAQVPRKPVSSSAPTKAVPLPSERLDRPSERAAPPPGPSPSIEVSPELSAKAPAHRDGGEGRETPRQPGDGPSLAEAAKAVLAGGPETAAVAPVEEAEPVVLVVDNDGVSRRFVEIALSKNGFVVETSKGATGALEILQQTLVDLVISETDLPDMNGLQLHRRLMQESRLRNIPFLFLSADTRSATKSVALESGVDDFLGKPCDPTELVARVRMQIARQKRQRENLRRRSYVLAGDFSALPLPDLVGILEMGGRTGTLALATESAVGEVLFEAGRVVHASFGNLTGTEAFYRLMEERGGQFEFSPQLRPLDASSRTIFVSATHLILEGARQLDHKRAEKRPSKPVAPTAGPKAVSPKEMGQKLMTATLPSSGLATHFELGVRDSFALGELRLWSTEEIAEWTLSPGGRDRFHVLLLADVPQGVSAMMTLASPPSEREILSGLSAENKLVGLDFFLRNERLLDIVLIDIRNASAFVKWLMRSPSLVMVVPPDGDFLALGANARVQLEALLEQLNPPGVMGVGFNTLEGNLRELPYMRRPGVNMRCLPGLLGEGSTDLRSLLVEGIRLWAAGAVPEKSGGSA